MADCNKWNMQNTVFTFVLLLFRDLQYRRPVNISETVASKKTLNSARQKLGPKSNLTVSAGRTVKINVFGSHTGR